MPDWHHRDPDHKFAIRRSDIRTAQPHAAEPLEEIVNGKRLCKVCHNELKMDQFGNALGEHE